MSPERTGVAAAAVLLAAGVIAYLALRGSPSREEPVAVAKPPEPEPTLRALDLMLDREASNEARVAAVRTIDRELNPFEVEKLRVVVRDRTEHPTLRNDVIELLESQRAKPDGLGADLLAMWRDEKEDPVWRDYCLQHMEPVHEFDASRGEIEKTLVEVSREGGRYAGTAMLSLERLGKRNPGLAANVLATARETVLAGEQDGEPDVKLDQEAAVTALQVARAAGDESVLDKARELATDTGILVRLRMSAVGTLGDIGKEDDLALLEKLCADPEKRVRRVARYNLAKLRKKYSQ